MTWQDRFEYLWRELFNRDYLLRDWEDGGRDVLRFISAEIERAKEEQLDEIISKITEDFKEEFWNLYEEEDEDLKDGGEDLPPSLGLYLEKWIVKNLKKEQ